MARGRALIAGLSLFGCLGCGGFRFSASDGGVDSGTTDLTGAPGTDDLSTSDLTGATDDIGGQSCPRTFELPCLDPASADVIEVPTEKGIADALAMVQQGQTIQIRGVEISGGNLFLPSGVTLHGCEGASMATTVAFRPGLGTVEGLTFSGNIVANQTGTYVVRRNRFASTTAPAVSARAIDGIVGAEVTIDVVQNIFQGEMSSVQADTSYDTMTRAIHLKLSNNIFTGVTSPVSLSEGGLVGRIDATVSFNTFYQFNTAIRLTSLTPTAHLWANLFVHGSSGIASDSAYESLENLVSQVVNPTTLNPSSGSAPFDADPMLIDPASGNFTPGAGSVAIDHVPTSVTAPVNDLDGCMRPWGPRADIGAIEVSP